MISLVHIQSLTIFTINLAMGLGLVLKAELSLAQDIHSLDLQNDIQTKHVREWILTPLYTQYDLQPRPTLHAYGQSHEHSYLRYDPFEPIMAHQNATSPAAVKLASAAISVLSNTPTGNELLAFTAKDTSLTPSAQNASVFISIFDSEDPNIAMLAFDPNYAEINGLYNESLDNHRMVLTYESTFEAYQGSGLDIGLTPRAGLSIGETGATAKAGLMARFGQYLNSDGRQPAWWFFAGADQKAVLIDPGQGFNLRQAVAMQPYAIVGDAQAGMAMRMGRADFSLAYVHRETRYSMAQHSWDGNEGFAAVSLTWKR